MLLWEPRFLSQFIGTRFELVWLVAVTVLMLLLITPLRAFPTASLSDCQTPTGWNCSDLEEKDTDVFHCDTESCLYDGECLKIGETTTCICDFKCSVDYDPVCGSNSQTYQNECFLRRDACKLQTEILTSSEGPCSTDAGSGSGDGVAVPVLEASGDAGAEQSDSSCEMCQFGAECDIDAEDVWCVCNIDCSHISYNPVCASDVRSYDNPCQVKEASCQRQEWIEVTHLGHCQGEGLRGLYIPCPDRYRNYCLHGDCQYPDNLGLPSCNCHSGFSGPQCEQKDYNVFFVVPGTGKIRYVLIASVIGALQITIITLVVLYVTRKCPGKKRRTGQKQTGDP
ncbi:hypothetical protein UPYG_G00024820 [Umbra pygmaea]|uniref:Tomoregulin-2-like n=1 Tax=Umbra pygmaea TaxID=75934 RepID=A0ABD0XLP6_UMBPY